jgi:hypothetical protein
MSEGINTEVRHAGRLYHVQTQTADRTAPVVETLIYEAGQVAVRMTASLAALSVKWRVAVGNVPRLLALQHWEMIHKIKSGMLDGDDPPTAGRASSPDGESTVPGVRPADSLAESEDPRVREVLAELDAKLDVLMTGGNPSSAPSGPKKS